MITKADADRVVVIMEGDTDAEKPEYAMIEVFNPGIGIFSSNRRKVGVKRFWLYHRDDAPTYLEVPQNWIMV